MPRLVAQSPEFEGKSFDLSGTELTVGRVADNKIQIEHASVSATTPSCSSTSSTT